MRGLADFLFTATLTLIALMLGLLLLSFIMDKIVMQIPSLREAKARGEELEDRLKSARATGIMSKFSQSERQERLSEIARRVRNQRRLR